MGEEVEWPCFSAFLLWMDEAIEKSHQRRSLPSRSPLKIALALKRPERLRAGRSPISGAHVLHERSAPEIGCGLAGRTFLNRPEISDIKFVPGHRRLLSSTLFDTPQIRKMIMICDSEWHRDEGIHYLCFMHAGHQRGHSVASMSLGPFAVTKGSQLPDRNSAIQKLLNTMDG